MLIRTASLIVSEALPRKRLQVFGIFNAIFNNIAQHFSAAHLGIYHNCLQLPVFPYLKFGSNDTDFFFYSLPVEQISHLTTGKINEYATLPFDIRYKIIR